MGGEHGVCHRLLVSQSCDSDTREGAKCLQSLLGRRGWEDAEQVSCPLGGSVFSSREGSPCPACHTQGPVINCKKMMRVHWP